MLRYRFSRLYYRTLMGGVLQEKHVGAGEGALLSSGREAERQLLKECALAYAALVVHGHRQRAAAAAAFGDSDNDGNGNGHSNGDGDGEGAPAVGLTLEELTAHAEGLLHDDTIELITHMPLEVTEIVKKVRRIQIVASRQVDDVGVVREEAVDGAPELLERGPERLEGLRVVLDEVQVAARGQR